MGLDVASAYGLGFGSCTSSLVLRHLSSMLRVGFGVAIEKQGQGFRVKIRGYIWSRVGMESKRLGVGGLGGSRLQGLLFTMVSLGSR